MLRRRRIFLQLAAEFRDVRVHRSGDHGCRVTPDFAQQYIARHDILTGAIKITQNCGFFFSETKKKWYASFQYTHNSNGEKLGLNWLSDKTTNSGIDALTVGLGYRF